jgi:hypothetical protein
VWHPRWLRWDWEQRKWFLALDGGAEVPIEPGANKWILFTPYGAHRPWTHGAWRACAQPWLMKQLAVQDWARHAEVHGSPVRVGTAPEGASAEVRAQVAADFAKLGADTAICLPAGFDLRFEEASGGSWQMFKAELDWSNTELAIALAGQNLTSEVSGGSYAAASVHQAIRQDLIEADARTLSTCLREQVVRWWAEYNLGKAELAPWPEWETEPPQSVQGTAQALGAIAQAVGALKQIGVEVDSRALLERTGVGVMEGEGGEERLQMLYSVDRNGRKHRDAGSPEGGEFMANEDVDEPGETLPTHPEQPFEGRRRYLVNPDDDTGMAGTGGGTPGSIANAEHQGSSKAAATDAHIRHTLTELKRLVHAERTQKKSASASDISKDRNSTYQVTGTKLEYNPFDGVSADMAIAAARAARTTGGKVPPSAILALFVKEGGLKFLANKRLSSNLYGRGTSVEDARSIARSTILFDFFGLDSATHMIPKGKNAADNALDMTNGKEHDEALKRLATFAGLNGAKLLNKFNRSMVASEIAKGEYTFVLKSDFIEASMELLGAVLARHIDSIKHLEDDTGGAKAFFERKIKPAKDADATSLAGWAFHSRVPSGSGQWGQVRRNAIRFMYFERSFRSLYE